MVFYDSVSEEKIPKFNQAKWYGNIKKKIKKMRKKFTWKSYPENSVLKDKLNLKGHIWLRYKWGISLLYFIYEEKHALFKEP